MNAVLSLLLALPARADTLVLKNGATMEGAIMSETAEEISIDLGSGEVSMPRSAVAFVRRSKKQTALTKMLETGLVEPGSAVPEGAKALFWAHQTAVRRRSDALAKRAEIADWSKKHSGQYPSESEEIAKQARNAEIGYLQALRALQREIGIQRGNAEVIDFARTIEARARKMESEFGTRALESSKCNEPPPLLVVINGKVQATFGISTTWRDYSTIGESLAKKLKLPEAGVVELDSLDLFGRIHRRVRVNVENSPGVDGLLGSALLRLVGYECDTGGRATFTWLK
jgi:hypothetical protein